MNPGWINALVGGVIIGIAVSLMLILNGRVTGIAGIINGALAPAKGDRGWRYLFVAGLVLGGLALKSLNPEVFGQGVHSDFLIIALAGLLVGFGTVMGSGCTSGHGVCGISRLSPRSLVATLVFMISGIGAVGLYRFFGLMN